jgi:hypothetical protein
VNIRLIVIAATSTIMIAGCGVKTHPMQHQVEEVANYLMGVMETTEQAAAIPDAPSVRMTTCEIELEETEAKSQPSPTIFLYQEQALTDKLDQPYRQRFLKITPSENQQQVESITFKPKQPESLIGLCNQPESERVITTAELGENLCSVFLQQNGSDYLGKTQPKGCATNFRGAVKITNTITLNEAGMDTLDRGFDAAGKQVWGAENRPYQFRRSPSQ